MRRAAVCSRPADASASLPAATAARAQDSSPDVPLAEDTAYAAGEYRVYTGAGQPATLDDIVAAMSNVSAVFIGETHDDPTQHMLEAELLKRAYEVYGDPATAGASARPVALSLEFFQRDTQEIVDEYLAGPDHRQGVPGRRPAVAAVRDRLPTDDRVREGTRPERDRRQRSAALREPGHETRT